MVPNGPIPEYVVHQADEVSGIAVCFSETDASRVAGALEAQDNPPVYKMGFSWQVCSERMPDNDTLVLIYTANDAMHVASHDGHNWWDAERFIIGAAVTHWCDPVPPAANEMFNHEETKNTKEIN